MTTVEQRRDVWNAVHDLHGRDVVVRAFTADTITTGRITEIAQGSFVIGGLLRLPFGDVERVEEDR